MADCSPPTQPITHPCSHCKRPTAQAAIRMFRDGVPLGMAGEKLRRSHTWVMGIWHKAVELGCTPPRTCALCSTAVDGKHLLCEACDGTAEGKAWRKARYAQLASGERQCKGCGTVFRPGRHSPSQLYCGEGCWPSSKVDYAPTNAAPLPAIFLERQRALEAEVRRTAALLEANRERSYELWAKCLGLHQ